MKLTKSKLKQIIKEELNKLMLEKEGETPEDVANRIKNQRGMRDNTINDFDNEINDLFSSLKQHEEKKQSVINLMKKGKSVVQKSENDNELISDWEIKLAEIEGEKK